MTVSRATSTSAAGTSTESYDYDPAPNAAIDPPGYTCTTSALPAGSVVCRNVVTGFVYVDAAQPLQIERHATFYSYDTHGRLIRTYGPVNLDRPVPGETPPREERTYWDDGESLARRGRLHEIKRYPAPGNTPLVTTYDYDALGVFQTIDERSGITTVVKDARGRPRFVVLPDLGVTETRYHDGSAPRLQVLPGGRALRYTYDAMGRVAKVEHLDGDPDAQPVTVAWTENYAYDAAGNRHHAERRDREGNVTWQQDRGFDVQHRVVWDSNPEQPSTGRSWTYDASGFLSGTTDEVGRGTIFVPDPFGRVQKVTRTGPPADSLDVAAYAYQGATRSVAEVLGGNVATGSRPGTAGYDQDDFGRLYRLKTATVEVGSQTFWYDARGNLVRKVAGDGSNAITTTYTYDGLDRVTSMTAGAVSYRYDYDAPPYQGLLTSVHEPDRTISYEYDALGRVVTESRQESGTSVALVIRHEYDPAGSVRQVTYPSGLRIRFDHDPATGDVVRVSSVETATRYVDLATHAPGGPLSGLSFGNGARLVATFDKRYQPTSLSSGPLLLGYKTNAAGDVIEISDRSQTLSGCSRNTSRAFTYDFLDRLTSSPSWFQYGYDGAGNRISQVVDGNASTFTNANRSGGSARADQLTARVANGYRVDSYLYDYHGNVSGVAVLDSSRQVQVECLRRDELGRLVAAGKGLDGLAWTSNGCIADSDVVQLHARFKYDHTNQRVARQDAATGQWTYIVSDAAGHPLSEMALVRGEWMNVRDYVWLDGQPLVQIEYPGPTAAEGYVYYLHTDHIGLPRAMTNANGQVVWNTYAKPYGDIAEKTMTDPLSGRVVVTNLRLPGQYDERLFGPLGLQGPYYNWNRWYLPGMGRYLEPDPLALNGEFNTDFGVDWYNYAEGNPLRWTDPFGLDRYEACNNPDLPDFLKKACKKAVDWRCGKNPGEQHLCCEADAATCRTAANGDTNELAQCELEKAKCEAKIRDPKPDPDPPKPAPRPPRPPPPDPCPPWPDHDPRVPAPR